MEITTLDTKTPAETGAWLHLRHPAAKHLLYSGEGADPKTGELIDAERPHVAVSVQIRGLHSKSVRDHIKQAEYDRITSVSERVKAKNNDPDHIPTKDELDREMAEVEKRGLALVCALVIDFKGLTKDGNPLECTDESKRAFFEQSDDLVSQVSTFAGDAMSFFGSGSAK